MTNTYNQHYYSCANRVQRYCINADIVNMVRHERYFINLMNNCANNDRVTAILHYEVQLRAKILSAGGGKEGELG